VLWPVGLSGIYMYNQRVQSKGRSTGPLQQSNASLWFNEHDWFLKTELSGAMETKTSKEHVLRNGTKFERGESFLL